MRFMESTSKNLIREAERICEQGHPHEAMEILNRVIENTRKNGDPEMESSALGHKIVCLKHIYQNTRDEKTLEKIHGHIKLGMMLPISEQHKAVFHLRLGDVYTARQDYQNAERSYRKAARLVRRDKIVHPEYLGHYAESKAVNGKPLLAIVLILIALRKVDEAKDILRPFHRLILVSGLYARLAKSAIKARKFPLALSALFKGYALAWWLAIKHKMPQRRKQYHLALMGKHV